MTNLKRPEIILFTFILLFSLFFRMKIIHELPLGVNTNEYGLQGFDDEPAHFNYSKYLSDHKSLPIETSTISDKDAFIKNEFEYHQPPLFYLASSIIWSTFNLSSNNDQLLLGRYINLLISIFSIYIAYLIFLQLGWQPRQALIGCSFFLLLGSHIYYTSLFSNDALSWLIIWTVFYLTLRGSVKNGVKISILLTLGHYTKSNILIIYPVILWTFYKSFINNEANTLRNVLLILLLPFLVASPWYYRNYILYENLFHLSGSEWHFVSSYFQSFTRLAHAPYSFLFKMHFFPPRFVILIFNYLQYVTIFPLIAVSIWKLRKTLRNDFNTQSVIILFFIMIFAYLWLAIPTGFTEGRMLFPALPVIVYLIFHFPFSLAKRIKNPEYFILILVCLLTMPSFISGFYF